MDRFDVFVLPSIKEGLPFVILEVGIRGLPVVATRIGGIPEIITDQKSGLLIEPKNSIEIARVVNLLLNDAALRQTYSSALAEVINKKFNFARMLQETATVYER